MFLEAGPGIATALAGVLAGGVITTGATLFLENRRIRRESSALARAFRGELSALVVIVEKRRYIGNLRDLITHMHSTREAVNFTIRVHREYFNVFNANIDKIGSLNDQLPERIVGFYVTANSILEDLELISDGGLAGTQATSQVDFYTELLNLFEEAMKDADEIIKMIDKMYSSKQNSKKWVRFI
jgi:hypothetical protein